LACFKSTYAATAACTVVEMFRQAVDSHIITNAHRIRGCGVCTVKCTSGAMKLHPRKQRVLHPENTFARVILQCLEKETLQNQLFDDPGSKTHAFMRGVVWDSHHAIPT
jgi:Fe-S-cluster-containing hydrogenase component 2